MGVAGAPDSHSFRVNCANERDCLMGLAEINGIQVENKRSFSVTLLTLDTGKARQGKARQGKARSATRPT